jgi:hypothetical protein
MKTFRAELVKILDKDNKKCRNFLDAVRSNLGIKKTFEQLFDDLIKNKGQVVMDPRISRAEGEAYWGKHRRDIGLGPESDRWERYVVKAIHELIHRAGVEQHKGFAQAAFDTLTDKEKADTPLPTKKDPGVRDMDDTYSDYFQRLLNKYCPPF